MVNDEDVPSSVDFHKEGDALAWVEETNRKRPWRAEFFQRFAQEIGDHRHAPLRVLELGCGPGLLAEQILHACPSVSEYIALDFSEAMLHLSRGRLCHYSERVRFVQTDFRHRDWTTKVGGPFEVVVTMQAVHEVRHKRHVSRLYEQVASVLSPGSLVLVCDRVAPDHADQRQAALFMTEQEHVVALTVAGFREATVRVAQHEMALYRAYA